MLYPVQAIKALRWLCTVSSVSGAIPFSWTTDSTLAHSRSCYKRTLSWFVALYTLGNWVFMVVRWVQAVCCMQLSYGELFLNLFNVITHAIASTFYLHAHLHGNGVVAFVESLMTANRRLQARFRWCLESYKESANEIGRASCRERV